MKRADRWTRGSNRPARVRFAQFHRHFLLHGTLLSSMLTDFPRLSRFLTAIHRRAVVLRAAERAGMSATVGAGLAMGFILLQSSGGAHKLQISLTLIAAGALVGLLWGVIRRPSRLDTAFRADSQLQLDDILGTAVTLMQRTREPQGWERSVLAIANAACARRSPRAVVLNRWGTRAWSAVALSIVLTITLALLSKSTEEGATRVAAAGSPTAEAPTGRAPRPLVALAPESPLGAHAPPGPEERQGPAGQANPDRTVAAKPPEPANNANPAGDPSGGATGGDPGGTGSGISKTARPPAAVAAANQGNPDSPTPTQGNAVTGQRPAGGGAARQSPGGAETSQGTGRASATASDATAIAPWRSEHWAADVQAAQSQLKTGQIAPAYRDLVRKYFDAR
jgi:hypothetical protein